MTSPTEKINNLFRMMRAGEIKKLSKEDTRAIDREFRNKRRDDSKRRFVKRLIKPRALRYQSLLRGAMASANQDRYTHRDGCKTKKRYGLCKCSRLNRNERKRMRQGRIRKEIELKTAEVKTK